MTATIPPNQTRANGPFGSDSLAIMDGSGILKKDVAF
jgi:hypothetical protein